MILGTKAYLAPEVFKMRGSNEAYKEPLDCWAAGIIMFYFISGRLPFEEDDLEEQIMSEEVDEYLYGGRWSNVSSDAKDLIKKLLNKSVVLRITAKQALEHDFFSSIREQKLN